MKEKSLEELKKLVEENNMDAIYELASRNYYGKDVEQNYEEAFKGYLIASENGIVDARYMVAFCYYYGKGVEIDYDKAFAIFCDL